MNKVAIIIPGYNCEQYISKCLNSILLQDDTEYTIFFIDDGSTDSTRSIVTAIKDERIKYIHQSNSGVSAARNRGLALAEDYEYIMFVDSDDWLEENAFITIRQCIEKSNDADYIVFDWNEYHLCNGEKKRTSCKMNDNFRQGISRDFLIKHLARSRSGGSPWGKLFKNEIIKKYNLRFVDNLPYAEDYLFNIAFLTVAQTVFYCPKAIYGYNCYQIGARAKFRKNLMDIFIEIEEEKSKLLFDLREDLYNENFAEQLEQLSVALLNLKQNSFSRQERRAEIIKAKNFLDEHNYGLLDIVKAQVNLKIKAFIVLFKYFIA